MKQILIVLMVILITVVVLLIKSNNDLKYMIEQQQQEIEASSKYIETLTDNLVQNSPFSHADKLRSQELIEPMDTPLENRYKLTEDQVAGYENISRNKAFVPDLIPVIGQYVISQRFKENHMAIDLAASLGSQVVSSATGEIVQVKEDKYFGNMIIIDHFNGFITVYAHLAKVLIKESDIVKKGMVIGLVGNTGNSTGPHLHFEILNNEEAIDPESLILFKD